MKKSTIEDLCDYILNGPSDLKLIEYEEDWSIFVLKEEDSNTTDFTLENIKNTVITYFESKLNLSVIYNNNNEINLTKENKRNSFHHITEEKYKITVLVSSSIICIQIQ